MIRCLSDNPQDLSAAVSQAKTMAGGKYDVTDDSARLSGVLQSVQTVRDLVRMVLLSRLPRGRTVGAGDGAGLLDSLTHP